MTNPPEMQFYWWPQLQCECGLIMRPVSAVYENVENMIEIPHGHGLYECRNAEAHLRRRALILVQLPPVNVIVRFY